ncbi:MAG: tripartite tricarboxylate transporter substrate binding protein [Burkholderiales bacterium]|nr:tripartite tricarboxylate transporter substrate binding protein [Burkholderiales bacterium]
MLLATGAVSIGHAQGYPNKPLRLVIGFAPGGSTDVSARLLAQRLSDILGQSVITENRPGAGTAIASAYVAKAAPDGYTLLLLTASSTILPAVRKDLPYDTVRDFAPISRVASTMYALVVHPSVPVKDVKDLIALGRRHGKMSYASEGVGTSGHLCGEMLKRMGKLDVLHVPYKGGAEATTAVASGQVDLSFPTITSALPLLGSGKVKILAVTSRTRSALRPDVPTLDESGLRGYERLSWNGLVGPAALPAEVITALHGATVKAVNSAEMKAGLHKLGLEPMSNTPEQFAEFVRSEIANNMKLLEGLGAIK